MRFNFIFLLLMSLSSLSHAADIPANAIPGLEAGILKYTNQHRATIGVPPLTETAKADGSAIWYSQEMAETGNYDHTMAEGAALPNGTVLPDGTAFDVRLNSFDVCSGKCWLVSENIYRDWYVDFNYLLKSVQTEEKIDALAQTIVAGWIAHPGHRRNLEDPFVDTIGIGVAIAKAGLIYATQDYYRTTTPLNAEQYKAYQASVNQADADDAALEAKALGNPPNKPVQ